MRQQLIDEIKRRGILPALGGHGLIEQDPEELADFVIVLKEHGIKRYLEVGTSRGAMFDFMVGYVGLDGWGINLFKPDFRADRVFVGNCNSLEALDFARSHGPYDLVFIDADHKYDSVCRDSANYGPMSTKFVAYHDICGLRDCLGSKQHWTEFSNIGKKIRTFVNHSNPVGIGLVFLNN